MDGERNVVDEEVDDVVVPLQDLEYGFTAVSNLDKCETDIRLGFVTPRSGCGGEFAQLSL